LNKKFNSIYTEHTNWKYKDMDKYEFLKLLKNTIELTSKKV